MSKSRVRTILGTGDFGTRLDLKATEEMLELFHESKNDEIDTALMYGGGKSEESIGKCKISQKMKIATKANPWEENTLTQSGVRRQLESSLDRLQTKQVDIFYLHAPDHNTPITETLQAVNELYQEQKFKEFGLSNYASWEVAEVVSACRNNNWIQPTVYQGMYNCLTRQVEKELFPCLKYYGIRFYAYNPLAGGLLSGKHIFEDWDKTEPGRFFGAGKWKKVYRDRYWRKENFESIAKIQTVLDELYGPGKVTMAEAAYRWLYHHSQLGAEKGDGVIIGASTVAHCKENLSYTTEGKLDDRVVEQMDKCWERLSHTCPNYFR
uniref:Aflatoxin B1 aldehyde reductase member 2-like n=1 Tax=Phallusia mammillata TaxID=59560 RepID=A0A6F9D5L8_9ASCI|nr:aflatoxin B1 aldehyde reductase member 2-like [Phallusia mammillata]